MRPREHDANRLPPSPPFLLLSQGAVIAPVKKLIGPVHVSYTPKKKAVGDTALDLTEPKVMAQLDAAAPHGKHG